MGKNRLIGWFFIWFATMIFLVFITQPDTRVSKFDLISFNTTESAELYFKNVRFFYYDHKEEGAGTLEAYRFSAMFEDTLALGVRFVIYNHWRQNLAFIRVDTNSSSLSLAPYLVCASSDGELDSIFVPDQSNESQFAFAKDIFLATREKNQIGLPNKTDTLWLTSTDIVNIRKTLRDYFKLVGKL